MDSYLDRLPQIFRMVAAISVVVMPPLLDISQQSCIVEHGQLAIAVKAGVVLVQFADLVLQVCHLDLVVFRGADHIDFLLRQGNSDQLAAKRAPDAEGAGREWVPLHYGPCQVICGLNCHHPAIKMLSHQTGKQRVVNPPGRPCCSVNTTVLLDRKPGRVRVGIVRLTYEGVQTLIAEPQQNIGQRRFIILGHEDDLMYELRLLAMLVMGDANHFLEIAKVQTADIAVVVCGVGIGVPWS